MNNYRSTFYVCAAIVGARRRRIGDRRKEKTAPYSGLLRRAARSPTPERSSPDKSRPDNLLPVKSIWWEANAASTSARVISAETMSGDVRSRCRITSCARAAKGHAAAPLNAAMNARRFTIELDSVPLRVRAALRDIELATASQGVSGPVQNQPGIGGPSGFRFGPDASIPPLAQNGFRAEVNSDA